MSRTEKARAKRLYHQPKQRGVFKVYRVEAVCACTRANAGHRALGFGVHAVGSVWSRRRAMIASSGIVGATRRVFVRGIAVPEIRDVSVNEKDMEEGRDW